MMKERWASGVASMLGTILQQQPLRLITEEEKLPLHAETVE